MRRQKKKRPERPPSRRDPNTYIVHLNPKHTHTHQVNSNGVPEKARSFWFIPAFSPGLPGNEKNLQTNEERKTRPEQSLVALVLGVQRSIGCIGRCEADGRRPKLVCLPRQGDVQERGCEIARPPLQLEMWVPADHQSTCCSFIPVPGL